MMFLTVYDTSIVLFILSIVFSRLSCTLMVNIESGLSINEYVYYKIAALL